MHMAKGVVERANAVNAGVDETGMIGIVHGLFPRWAGCARLGIAYGARLWGEA